MSQVPDINTIIQVAKISQYLYDRAIYSNKFYNNQPLDKRKPELIFIIRKDVEWVYQTNPSDINLPKTGEFLFGLCSPFTQQALQIINNTGQQRPVIAGPANQSVNVGQTATFSVTVTSSLPVTYQWYRNGVLIPGAILASYPFPNAQLSNNGDTFYVIASNSAGSATSGSASLTVSAALIGYYYYSDVNPYPSILAHVDSFAYQINFAITHNVNPAITLPSAATPNKYGLAKIPIGEPVYIKWTNSSLNFGDIPDPVWEPVEQFGGFSYYATRGQVTFDPASPLTLKSS